LGENQFRSGVLSPDLADPRVGKSARILEECRATYPDWIRFGFFFFGGKKVQMMRKKVAKRTEEIAGARIRKLDGDGLFMARLAMVLVGVLQG
jgi:hypothetical protein